ncbi:MAG: type II secretion system protein, partial [Synergistaceae bacterium]|nr:type II secretion system protein [Synergistaceae bacterium]
MRNRRGFSLIELLVVMLIIGVIAASSSFMFSDVKDGNKLIREEADNFALWLTDRMSRAQFEECSFKLSMSEEGTRNTSFRLLWQDGTQHGKI